MTTTDPIIIPIEGDASDFVKDAGKVNAELDKMTKATKSASGANTGLAGTVKKASVSITDLRSAYMIAADAARVASQVWQATGQEFVNYAEQVKNMSRNIGASAEETSRLIQVADDVRVSYESLGTAMKFAQKDGIEPNIEGLAKLADQYNALSSPIEKQAFLLDKFGKSGLEMGKLMEQGGEGIRSMSAAIDENMIITAEGIKASDEYQHSLDEMNDSYAALKITIGSYLVGPATDLLNHYRDINTSLKENGYWYTVTHQFALDDIEAKREEADAAFLAAGANDDFSSSLDNNASALSDNKDAIEAAKGALKDYQDQLEETSQANIDNESTSRKIAEDQKQYAEDHAAAIKEQADAQLKLNEALSASGGDGTAEAVDEARAAYDEATLSVQKLEAASMQARESMIYDMILAKLAVDGLTDSELKAADAYAITAGLKTQADVDETNKRIDEANAVVEGIKASEDVMVEDKKIAEETKRLETSITAAEAIAANGEQAASVDVVTMSIDSATQSYYAMAEAARAAASAAATIPPAGSSAPLSDQIGPVGSRDSGGAGFAGVPYMIGRGAQPELFVPSSNGTFIPNADKKGFGGGATYNITITNAKPESSENSIRRALKNVSYMGMAA